MRRAVDLIAAKRRGESHDPGDLTWLIGEYVAGRVPDYQMAAWLMAVCFSGLDHGEAVSLTEAMVRSGETVDFSGIAGIVVDKHSTGGVGDKVTLVLGPLMAACGLPFAKMSGRGLGHTGGTIDKLESIPGYRTDLSVDEFTRVVEEVGVAVIGQTARMAPADRQLYALRDVTATVEQEALIAASVMSKKIAGGATCVVLDVKVGEGAFVADEAAARRLAALMIGLGEAHGQKVGCVLTDMGEPLGYAVGNGLEVREAMSVLAGGGPSDVREVVLALAARLLVLAEAAVDPDAARDAAARTLDSGEAQATARRWIAAQGGDPEVVDGGRGLPTAPVTRALRASTGGTVLRVHPRVVADACTVLGAGRAIMGVGIDPAVGVVLGVGRGDEVEADDILARIHARREDDADAAIQVLGAAFELGEGPARARSVVVGEL